MIPEGARSRLFDYRRFAAGDALGDGAGEGSGVGELIMAGAAVVSLLGAAVSAAGVGLGCGLVASRACFASAARRQTYEPTPLPNFAAPLRKNSFEPGTSHTTASAAALHAFVAARYFAADAASLAVDEAATTSCAAAGENSPVAHDAASAIAAKPLNGVRIH